ncbi:MAG: DUF4476 domain-containing protein [Cyanobacteria bacterium J06588_5]
MRPGPTHPVATRHSQEGCPIGWGGSAAKPNTNQYLIASASIFLELFKVLTRSTGHVHPSWLATVIAGISIGLWQSPALAAPQLTHQAIVVPGNQNTCLSRAQSAIARIGITASLSGPNSIAGSNDALSANVYCQPIGTPTFEATPNFQAIVMLAIREDTNPAALTTALDTVEAALLDPNQTTLQQSAPGDDAGLTSALFAQYLGALEDSWPNYLGFLRETIPKNKFTARQAQEIVAALDYPDQELRAALLLYPRIIDPQNWPLVERAITFNDTRLELQRRIDNLQASPASPTP